MEDKIGLPKITHIIFPMNSLRFTYKGVLEDYWYVKVNCSEFLKIDLLVHLFFSFQNLSEYLFNSRLL